MSAQNNEKIVNMLALSDEISVLNYKLKQLVEDLQSDERVFATIKDISFSVVDKASKFNKELNGYTPDKPKPDVKANPSYVDGINEKVRVVPTPENWRDFVDAIPEENMDKSLVPNIEDLTDVTRPMDAAAVAKKREAKINSRRNVTTKEQKEAYRKQKNVTKKPAPPKKPISPKKPAPPKKVEKPKKKGFFNRG